MIELKGKRNKAVIYADRLDPAVKTQLASLLREEAYSDSKIRIMPDTHSGKGAVVGTTMTIGKRIQPALLGVDIGCGMEVVCLAETDVDLPKLDRVIHEAIPCGAKIHDAPVRDFSLDLYCAPHVDKNRALRSLGTLGSGNHFIELDRASDGSLLLVIHSGSRQLGSDAATHYQDQAYRQTCQKARSQIRRSSRGEGDDASFCRSIRRENRGKVDVRREEALLEGALFDEYRHDLAMITAFAEANRCTIAERICNAMGFTVKDRFSCVHNTIDPTRNILRKGAISAERGQRVIIPLNMRDGAVLGVGLGNPDWNYSAPHGAGRVCSRTNAKFAYTMEDYHRAMEGIYTTTAQPGSLDECPMAYKAPERILPFLAETVEITEIIKPIYNFKAC